MGDEADRSAFPILIVDDQERNLIALESVLRNVHGPVIRASSGEQALALSLRHRFALAILDVQMPGMDGYELAELLVGERTADPLPIIFVTAAYADDDHRARGYTSGAVDYLLKPIEPAILLAKVKVFVELARARAEIERLLSQQTQSLAIKSGQLTRKAAFQAMLSTSTTSLVGREAADPFAGVRDTLEAVATHLGATHASAHVVRANSIGVQVAIEREPLVAASTAGTLGARLMALLGARLAHGEAVLLPSFAVLAENERTALEMLGVRALLILPAIGPEQRLAGSVTFSWGGSTRTPVPDLVDVAEHLALLPTMICAAIERIESERERSNAVAQKGVLFETMSQGVIYCDVAGNVLAMNGMATRILGPDAAECFGHSASTSRFEFTDQAGAPLAAADLPWARAARTCQTVSNVVVGVMHPTWSAKRWLIIDAVPIFQAGQATPYQVYLVFSDFEALRRATEAIRRADDAEAESRKKSDILASVSHEIRTPLNACLGYTKLLLRDPTLRGKQREYLQAIDRSGSHLVTLVNNVLDMARAEAGEGISDPVDADPKDVLEMIEQMFRLRAEEKGLARPRRCRSESPRTSAGLPRF